MNDQRSDAAKAYRRWYWTPRWRKLAKRQLQQHPLCSMCEVQGRVTVATVCDHVEPHHGDPVRFWSGPFQSLCAAHHNSTKQREEKQGHAIGSDLSGRPLDPAHPWNTR